MAEYALGWLGWSEEQALSADVNAIGVGIRGRYAMLRAAFGTDDSSTTLQPTIASRPLSPQLFDAVFK